MHTRCVNSLVSSLGQVTPSFSMLQAQKVEGLGNKNLGTRVYNIEKLHGSVLGTRPHRNPPLIAAMSRYM